MDNFIKIKKASSLLLLLIIILIIYKSGVIPLLYKNKKKYKFNFKFENLNNSSLYILFYSFCLIIIINGAINRTQYRQK